MITPEELHEIRDALAKAEAELTWALQSYAPTGEGKALTEALRKLHQARIIAHNVDVKLRQNQAQGR